MCRSGRNLQQLVREIVQEPLAQEKREVLPRPVAEIVKRAVSKTGCHTRSQSRQSTGEQQ